MSEVKVKGVITDVARKKLCKAHAGDIALPPITHMAWGDGGLDEAGAAKVPTGKEIGLYNQLLRKEVEGRQYVGDGETTCRYVARLEKGELTGKEISEVALFDSDGDMVAYRALLRKGKDEDLVLIFSMDEIF